MGAAKKIIDKKMLRDLVPINALSAAHIEEISRKALIEDVRSGTYVFKRGDRDYQTVFLLEGKVELVDENRNVVGTVASGSENARHPLAHKQPRQLGARASGKVTVARVDSSLLDVLLTWDESSGYDVQEIDSQEDDDWMTRMLQSQAFLQLPPSNIHQLLMRLEAVNASAGDVVVRQGEEGDYFYIVKSGRLAVTRKASARSKEVLLAELGEGACFGEEALVSGTKRNASVMMITDGSLMRLSKDDFNELLCASLVHEADYEGATKLVAKGASWLDVRLPGEFENQAIKGSVNVPLSALRDQCESLDADTDYIVCCDTGRRSAAGAFVLSQRGFRVYTLKNGLMDVPDIDLEGKPPAAESETQDRNAEIIPFETDVRAEPGEQVSKEEQPSAEVDDQLIDRLASLETDKLSLEKQLAGLTQERDEARQQLEEQSALQQADRVALEKLVAEVDDLRSGLAERDNQSVAAEQARQSLQEELDSRSLELEQGASLLASSEQEKATLQAELDKLQAALASAESAAEERNEALRGEVETLSKSLAKAEQARSLAASGLQDELSRVKEDYAQLGQRTSQVAGERDAAVASLEEVNSQLTESRATLEAAEAGQAELQALLDQKVSELESIQAGSSELSTELEQVRQSADEQLAQLREQWSGDEQQLREQLASLEEQLAEASRKADSERQEADERLRSLQAELDEARSDSRSQNETREQLEQQLAELQQSLDATGQSSAEQLERLRSEAAAEKSGLEVQLEALQQARDEAQATAAQLQSGQEALEQQLESLRQENAEKSAQLERAEAALQTQSEQIGADKEALGVKLGETEARIAGLESELGAERDAHSEAAKRIAVLDEQLTENDRQHEKEFASAREAMSRAQTETENLKREQTRQMEKMRKLERDLERERHDHETEVHRLHKELKDLDGETGSGLEAELEALQEKIRIDARARDDLEIKLGERSAQIENLKADTETLSLQLGQAQESAREAEQQLIEATRAANEEMAVRIEVEEKAQAALRDELASVVSERNSSREQLTVQEHELEELRAGMEQATRSLAAGEQDTAEQQKALEALSAERDEAIAQREQLQSDLDQLRAEAEVTRGLVDMQAPTTDEQLREALEEAQKNVDVAVRLRSQAEERVGELEAELARLRESGIEAAGSPAPQVPDEAPEDDIEMPEINVPALDDMEQEEDGSDSSLEGDAASQPAASVLLEEPSDPAPVAGSGGRKTGVVAVIVVLVALLAVAGWWFTRTAEKDAVSTTEAAVGAGSVVTQGDARGEPAASGTETGAQEKAGPPTSEPLADIAVEPSPVAPEAAAPAAVEAPVTPSVPVSKQPAGLTEPEKTPQSVSTDASRVIPGFAPGGDVLRVPDATNAASDEVPEAEVLAPETADETGAVADEPQTPAPVAAPVRRYSQPLSDGGRGPQMVEFAASRFQMGSSDSSANFDERPRHAVSLRPFSISRQEVSFADYDRFARATGRRLPSDNGWGRGKRPVVNVSWEDAQAYTRWLSNQTGSQYRLPSEAEWEFAARGGTLTLFAWGNDLGKSNANCFNCGGASVAKTLPAGSFTDNAFGIQDMAGNVMEWVQDCYSKSYDGAPADGSARLDGDCARRMVRGGAFDSPSDSIRPANRDSHPAAARLNNLGFRVVKAAH